MEKMKMVISNSNVKPIAVLWMAFVAILLFCAIFKLEAWATPNEDLLHAIMQSGDLKAARIALEKGADANIRVPDVLHSTALMQAAFLGRLDIVRLLLEYGADVDAQTQGENQGITALMGASGAGHTEIIKLLLEHGANVNAGTESGLTALMAALDAASPEKMAILRLLLEHGADVNAKVTDGDLKGFTILMEAAQRGDVSVVQFLLEHHAEINAEIMAESQYKGWTALSFAQSSNHPKVVQLLKNAGTKETKLSPGFNPTQIQKINELEQQTIKLYEQGHYAEAIPLSQKLLEIRKQVLGPEHPGVATSLHNLAVLYISLSEYSNAEPLLKESLMIRQKALGAEHPDVAHSLNHLALVYASRGEYLRAEAFHQQALKIQQKMLGTEHADVAMTLGNLAELYESTGEYAKAKSFYTRALALQEKTLGSEHPTVAQTLNNLAELYKSLGEYAKAEPLHQRALTIKEKALGSEHPAMAISLGNLAGLYSLIGDYTRAEPLFNQALAISEKALGPEHPDVATGLNNLAMFYHSFGKYTKAELFYKRALAISKKALGPEHPVVAKTLNNLAELYLALGGYLEAEPLLTQALAIRENIFGPEHPEVARNINNLATLYMFLDDYAKAESLFKRALTIYEKFLGSEHPEVVIGLNNITLVYAALENFEHAHKFSKQARQIDEKLIDQVMGFTSEEQKLRFLTLKKWHLDASLSLVSQHLIQNLSARKDALDIWLRRKGVILEAQKRFQEALVYSDEPEAVTTFQELSRVRAQISRLTFAGPGNAEPETYKQKIAELETRKEELEGKLSRLSQTYALKQKITKADVEKVAKALPANTVLLEFARVGLFNFKAKGYEKHWNPAHYLAFVLHAGNSDNVGLIDLGEADTIDRAVAAFKQQIPRGRLEKRDFETLTTSSEQVYTLVFAPLKEELGEVKEIFISPDGNLNLIPFEVLIGPDGRFLIEEYTFNYLVAGRDVLGFGEIKGEGNNPLLIGDPDFDLEFKESEHGQNVKRSTDMRGFQFKRLPWTKTEVETIQTLLGKENTVMYTGNAATEDILMHSGAPRILHLATHGFFLQDQDWQAFQEDVFSRGTVISFQPPGSQDFVLTPPMSWSAGKLENPLLRSGIALAGANTATGEERHSQGIVTAEKILGLKLRGTDMVVLSACETGLGDVQAGEGVFGLRRAFTQAGAKSLVMSLWSVPDQETQELMVQFYQNLLSGKMSRSQALRQAVLQQMYTVKERYGCPHPLYWGAFVFMGES